MSVYYNSDMFPKLTHTVHYRHDETDIRMDCNTHHLLIKFTTKYRHSDTKNTFQFNPIYISTVVRLYKTAILKTNKDI